MNPQFKFEKQSINENAIFNTTPEQVIMLSLQNDMKRFNFRSYKSYLKDLETKRIQRTSISIKEISSLLKVSTHCAEQLAIKWMNEIGGCLTQHADLNTYYFKETYEIIN